MFDPGIVEPPPEPTSHLSTIARMSDVRVCRDDVAPIRAEPDDGAEQVTQALRGEPLSVEELRDGWARVRTAYDYPGWIRERRSGPGPRDSPWDVAPGAASRGDPVDEARSYLGTPVSLGRHDRAAASTAPGSST